MNDDIFGENQTPEDKFFEILCAMNKDVVRNQLTALFQKLVYLENMVDDEDIDRKVLSFQIENQTQMDQMIQNLYLHITADMLGQHES